MADSVQTVNDSNKIQCLFHEGTIFNICEPKLNLMISHYVYCYVYNLIRSHSLVAEIKPLCRTDSPFMCTFCARISQFVYKAPYDCVYIVKGPVSKFQFNSANNRQECHL
jgi:hypothetical protein